MFWDKMAFLYDFFETVYNKKVFVGLGKEVAKYIDPSDRVLECACGTGAITVQVAPFCKELLATDYSEGMLKQARKKCRQQNNVTVQKINILSIPYEDNSFDKVIAGNVIHLLDDPKAAMSELQRVCKPGGTLIIPTYINNDSKSANAAAKLLELIGADFKRQFSLGSYKDFFKGMGFESVEYDVVNGRMPCAIAIIDNMKQRINKIGEIENVTYTDDFEYSLDSNVDARTSFFLRAASNAWDSIVCHTIEAVKPNETDWNALYHNALRRYKAYANELSYAIKRKNALHKSSSIDESLAFRYSMISMILAGSLLEATIQFFLLTYLDDYKKDSKYHWVIEGRDVEISIVRERLIQSLDSMVSDDIITSSHKKSIRKAIESRLKPHEDWENITKFTLEDLISFCKENIFTGGEEAEDKSEEDVDCPDNNTHGKIELTADLTDPFFALLNESLDAMFNRIVDGTEELSDDQIIAAMTSIQKARNNIHIFTEEKTNTVEETDNNIMILCLIINDLGTRIYSKDLDVRRQLNDKS